MFEFEDPIFVKQKSGKPSLYVKASEVIQTLSPQITKERLARIDQVVNSRCFSCFPVLEGIYDRGNISAVLRSAEALGFGQALVIESQERFKESQRTTAGADKWVEISRFKQTLSAVEHLKKNNIQIISTALTPKAVPIETIDFTKPTALVLGNEKSGVTPEMQEASDHCVMIPMDGFVQSFNISVAGALALWVARHQRLAQVGRHADLSMEQKQILSAHYMLRTLDSGPATLAHTYL